MDDLGSQWLCHIRGLHQRRREGPIIKRQIEILKAPKNMRGELEPVAAIQEMKCV